MAKKNVSQRAKVILLCFLFFFFLGVTKKNIQITFFQPKNKNHEIFLSIKKIAEQHKFIFVAAASSVPLPTSPKMSKYECVIGPGGAFSSNYLNLGLPRFNSMWIFRAAFKKIICCMCVCVCVCSTCASRVCMCASCNLLVRKN